MKKTRINLGCGNDYIEGWINVDVNSAYKPDIIADLSKKFPFQNESVDEIKAFDILEHFTKEQGEFFLQECYRVLKNNGVATLRIPNIYEIYSKFKDDPEVLIHFLYGDTKKNGLFGSHKYGFSHKTIEKLMRITGFESISIASETTNIIVSATKKKINKRPLRIGIIQHSPDIGGAEMYMKNLIGQFKKAGHKITCIASGSKFLSLLKSLHIPVHNIPFVLDYSGNLKGLIKSALLSPFAFLYFFWTLSILKKQRVDVLFIAGFSEKIIATFVSAFLKIPVVWIEYGPLKPVFRKNYRVPKILYKLVKDIPFYVIVPSEHTKQSVMTDARISQAKIEVIPCGVEIPKAFQKTKHKNITIGSVSRLTEEKGQQYLIKAMPYILKKYPTTQCVIIGDGPSKESYKALIQKLKIEKNVILTGFIRNHAKFYKKMDLFVFPTVWELEGFGLVAVEAMSYGLPVISFDIPPLDEIITEKVGVRVKQIDEKKLADAIIKILQNKAAMEQISEAGKKRVRGLYSIEKSASAVLKVLHKTVITSDIT